MREHILQFLAAIDTALVAHARPQERLDLYVIGKAAVILFYDGEQIGSLTSDVDVVKISNTPVPLLSIAFEQFGKRSRGAKESDGLYLESVQDALPPLAASFRARCTAMAGDLGN